jgi:hypothetical protein
VSEKCFFTFKLQPGGHLLQEDFPAPSFFKLRVEGPPPLSFHCPLKITLLEDLTRMEHSGCTSTPKDASMKNFQFIFPPPCLGCGTAKFT